MKHLRTLISAAASLAVSACVPQTKPPQQAVPPTSSPPTMTIPLPGKPAPHYTNWLDAPQTPGDWTYTNGAQSTLATFGEAGKEPRFRMTCDRASRRITLARLGVTAAQGMTMKVRTESMNRDLPTATPDRSKLETLAYLPASDPLLDAMAFSKGRFAIELDLMKLYLPSWPEVTRVIEDCR